VRPPCFPHPFQPSSAQILPAALYSRHKFKPQFKSAFKNQKQRIFIAVAPMELGIVLALVSTELGIGPSLAGISCMLMLIPLQAREPPARRCAAPHRSAAQRSCSIAARRCAPACAAARTPHEITLPSP
jgi:hypothetical protein